MIYYFDYPNEPIGGTNPYYRCSSCKKSDPEINGSLDKHEIWCTFRIQKESEISVNNCTSFSQLDKGPWTVDEWPNNKIVIQSDDFHYDAALEISGDFGSKQEKLDYANALCLLLNKK